MPLRLRLRRFRCQITPLRHTLLPLADAADYAFAITIYY